MQQFVMDLSTRVAIHGLPTLVPALGSTIFALVLGVQTDVACFYCFYITTPFRSSFVQKLLAIAQLSGRDLTLAETKTSLEGMVLRAQGTRTIVLLRVGCELV